MNSSIITIGDEILIGQIVDTNSAFIAKCLSNIGLRISDKISIGDNAAQISSTLDKALTENKLVIVTGGLGPTKDDITKHTLAAMFDSKMVENKQVTEHVKALTKRRGITFNALNASQAMVPEVCTTIFNIHGTAPAMWFERDGHVLISLPGVPFEMEQLMLSEIIPRLKSHFSLRENIHRTMITSGLAESILAETIEEWENGLPEYIKLAYLPSFGRVRLRLSAYQIESGNVREELNAAFAALEKIIPQYVVGYESASIEQIVHEKLLAKGAKLAIAESCTGGAIAAKFTALAGTSGYLECGVVSYSNDSKEQILGVAHATLEEYGAVSEQVALEMAEGAKRIAGADYAVATTGIAGPTGGSAEKPVGTVWFGIATPEGSFAKMVDCGTERSQIIGRATATAITMLRDELIK
ncbi:MAG: CinA family nicotinamide mononucleotide deamidase-related protein [Rikenellaceae bacterium]